MGGGPPFLKMHGLGNDFVVLDLRGGRPAPPPEAVRAIGDRRRGVGFDQLLSLEDGDGEADAVMGVWNPDGSRSGACGNGTRCVASLVMGETGADRCTLRTARGLLECEAMPDGQVRVDMGAPQLGWREVPLAREADTLAVPLDPPAALGTPVAVGMGNPHAVFFVDDAEAVDLPAFGPSIEHHPMFPERTNVEVVSRLGQDRLRMRVWERSAGITQACGSGACAVAVAAARRGLTGRRVEVVLDGGPLTIEWGEDDRVRMTGPVALSFEGVLDPSLWDGREGRAVA